MINQFIDDQGVLSIYDEVLTRVDTIPGVTGVDAGYIYVDGEHTGRIGVRVYTSDEETRSVVAAALGRSINDVTVSTEVMDFRLQARGECEPVTTSPPPTDRHDPILPGVSVSNFKGTSGTLGMIVEHATEGRCILSCAHVLLPKGKDDCSVVQPGTTSQNNTIALTHPGLVDRPLDAALAVLNRKRRVCPGQYGTGVVVRTVCVPRLGDTVTKSGITTRVTSGRVDGSGLYLLRLDGDELFPPPGILRMFGTSAFTIARVDAGSHKPISDNGDSGAVWYTNDGHAGVGLHLSGGAEGSRAVAACLRDVLERLKATPWSPAAVPEGTGDR